MTAKNAFSLIEIMITLAIVGLLATFAVQNVSRSNQSARRSIAKQDLARIGAAIENLAWDTGRWPGGKEITLPPQHVATRFNDLTLPAAGLLANGGNGDFPNWRGPYMDIIPLDPWGEPYFFEAEYRPGGISRRRTVIGSRGGVRDRLHRHHEKYIIHSLEHIFTRTQ